MLIRQIATTIAAAALVALLPRVAMAQAESVAIPCSVGTLAGLQTDLQKMVMPGPGTVIIPPVSTIETTNRCAAHVMTSKGEFAIVFDRSTSNGAYYIREDDAYPWKNWVAGQNLARAIEAVRNPATAPPSPAPHIHPGTADDPAAACHPYCGPAPMDGWFLSKQCVGGPQQDPLVMEQEMKNHDTLAWSRHFVAADGMVVTVIIVDSDGRVPVLERLPAAMIAI